MTQSKEERNAKQRAYRAAHREEFNAKQRAYVSSRREEYREHQRAYEKRNQEARNARQRADHAARRDERNAYERAHRLAHPEIDRNYYAKNKEKIAGANKAWADANPDKVATKRKVYEQRNPDKMATKRHNRRARVRGNGGRHTVAEWRALCAWFGNVCLRCGASGKLSRDHVVPTTAGGTNNISNIQPLCGPCNSSKLVKTVDYRDTDQLAAFLDSLRNPNPNE